jgi:hypothetical protein
MAAAKKKQEPTATPTSPGGVAVGDLVWFADRSNGRTTEHLGKIAAIGRDGALALVVRDQGEERRFEDVKPWVADAVRGWWRAR